MDMKKNYGTNKVLENEGVWVDLGDGASIKVARVGNKENTTLVKRLTAPHKVAIRANKLPDEIWEKITIEAVASTILLDWKGLKEDGKLIPYSKENAVQLLTDYKDFRDQVSGLSSELALFQAEDEAAVTKN